MPGRNTTGRSGRPPGRGPPALARGDATKPDDIVVVLDPGHGVRYRHAPDNPLCLTALEESSKPGRFASSTSAPVPGILAIAAAMLGAAHVDAVDIEPVVGSGCDGRTPSATALRTDHIRSVRADEADPVNGATILLLANIIARILIEISRDLAAAVKPGGTADSEWDH